MKNLTTIEQKREKAMIEKNKVIGKNRDKFITEIAALTAKNDVKKLTKAADMIKLHKETVNYAMYNPMYKYAEKSHIVNDAVETAKALDNLSYNFVPDARNYTPDADAAMHRVVTEVQSLRMNAAEIEFKETGKISIPFNRIETTKLYENSDSPIQRALVNSAKTPESVNSLVTFIGQNHLKGDGVSGRLATLRKTVSEFTPEQMSELITPTKLPNGITPQNFAVMLTSGGESETNRVKTPELEKIVSNISDAPFLNRVLTEIRPYRKSSNLPDPLDATLRSDEVAVIQKRMEDISARARMSGIKQDSQNPLAANMNNKNLVVPQQIK